MRIIHLAILLIGLSAQASLSSDGDCGGPPMTAVKLASPVRGRAYRCVEFGVDRYDAAAASECMPRYTYVPSSKACVAGEDRMTDDELKSLGRCSLLVKTGWSDVEQCRSSVRAVRPGDRFKAINGACGKPGWILHEGMCFDRHDLTYAFINGHCPKEGFEVGASQGEDSNRPHECLSMANAESYEKLDAQTKCRKDDAYDRLIEDQKGVLRHNEERLFRVANLNCDTGSGEAHPVSVACPLWKPSTDEDAAYDDLRMKRMATRLCISEHKSILNLFSRDALEKKCLSETNANFARIVGQKRFSLVDGYLARVQFRNRYATPQIRIKNVNDCGVIGEIVVDVLQSFSIAGNPGTGSCHVDHSFAYDRYGTYLGKSAMDDYVSLGDPREKNIKKDQCFVRK